MYFPKTVVLLFLTIVVICANKQVQVTVTTATIPISTTQNATNQTRYFGIQGNQFIKDGHPFRYISGSFHYFRAVREKWADILGKFKLAGLNTVQTYVEWSSHQPTSAEEYNFAGNLDLFAFIEEAEKNDLLVILRPGPFIDAERSMGGLPPWLLWQKKGIQLRTSDLQYIYFVSRWFDHLLPCLVPYLYENGGPIIMVQVENEYGSFGCDKNYTTFLRDLLRQHLGSSITLFTTDGSGESYLNCGSIPDVFATVDFGPGFNVGKAFELEQKYNNGGPLVNSEFYTGWLDHWQRPHSTQDSQDVKNTLLQMLIQDASVNFYMFYGGTSFGFTAGSNLDNGIHEACPTSYDYDAPLNEAGDPTKKYWQIRKIVSQFVAVPEEKPVISCKGNYGSVQMTPFSHLLHPNLLLLLDSFPIYSKNPLSFEELKLASGFVLYQTLVQNMTSDPVLLSAVGLKDRAYILVENVQIGILSRTEQIFSIPISIKKGSRLSILVENQGRPCYGSKIGESKGLGPVTLGSKPLENWTNYRLGELNVKLLEKFARTEQGNVSTETSRNDGSTLFYYGNFTLPMSSNNGTPLDTFVRFDGWTKGMIWVNGFNLGRYWPVVGPQETLYLPSNILKAAPASNTFLVFELENAPTDCIPSSRNALNFYNNCYIELTNVHVLNGTTPYNTTLSQGRTI